MFKKRGQAALEFLTTYGWAFLVILVLIGALSYFGVLTPSKYVSDSCKLSGLVECGGSFAIVDNSSVDGKSIISINLKNNLADNINVTAIKATEKTDNSYQTGTNLVADGTLIAPQSSGDVTFEFTNNSLTADFLNTKKSFYVQIIYHLDDSAINAVSEGVLVGVVQSD